MKIKKLKKKIEEKLDSPENFLRLILTKSHHFLYELYYKSKKIAVFRISHGSREPGKRLIGMMAGELGLSSTQLEGIANCTFWARDFVLNSRYIEQEERGSH